MSRLSMVLNDKWKIRYFSKHVKLKLEENENA